MSPETAALRANFQRFAAQWRAETGFLSNLSVAYRNPHYQHILAMGRPAIPLILEELRERPDHWFHALAILTGLDVASDCRTVTEARIRWLQWGEVRQLLEYPTETKVF